MQRIMPTHIFNQSTLDKEKGLEIAKKMMHPPQLVISTIAIDQAIYCLLCWSHEN
jgi:hypothetical protein